MSFIHYKLITNQNYEKIAFDGVSLSVAELKKIVMEKKFRKHLPSSSSSNTANTRRSDVDLEVTNVDTNEVYKNDAEMIPKNSRVQINRVVRNIGPAIEGGTITQTHKESEQMSEFRNRFMKEEKKSDLDLDDSILLGSNGSKASDTHSGHDSSDASLLYADILLDNNPGGVTALTAAPLDEDDAFFDQKEPFSLVTKRIDIKIPNGSGGEQERPSDEYLCPFDDGQAKHLMDNAIIVPCCGYFICCEKCIRDKLSRTQFIECPHESCTQEITINHRLTPYTPIRNKINDYLKLQSFNLNIPIEKLQTKFPINTTNTTNNLVVDKAQDLDPVSQQSPIKTHTPHVNTVSPGVTNRPVIKLAVKLNSPKPIEHKKEPTVVVEPITAAATAVAIEPEIEGKKSMSGSPVSSRSSSPSKISSDSESNSKISQDGSISPVSQSQDSRSSSPSSVSTPSLKDEHIEIDSKADVHNEPEQEKQDEILQQIQPLYNQQYIPPQQQFYPYNMPPTGQLYPQMDPFFNQRYPRPNFPIAPNQQIYNPNMMRFPPPGTLPAQNYYTPQMYPGAPQQFMPNQFYQNRMPVPNGYQYQNFPQKWNGNPNRRRSQNRSRSRSRSRRSPDRYRRKRSRSHSRSRSRSSSRYHKRSRRSRSRSSHRRDAKRQVYRRRSSSRRRDYRDRSRSRRDDRVKEEKQVDPKPVNKENEMDLKEKTVHKLTNLMHKKANIEPVNTSGANGGGVTVTLVNSESQHKEDTKKNRIVFMFKANSDEKKDDSNNSNSKKANSIKELVSPVKKAPMKRKVHLKKELATSTVKKATVIQQKVEVEKKSQDDFEKIVSKEVVNSMDRADDDILDISVDEKINL